MEDFNISSLSINNNEVSFSQVDSLIGWDSNYILEDYMGVASLNQQTKALINSMYIERAESFI